MPVELILGFLIYLDSVASSFPNYHNVPSVITRYPLFIGSKMNEFLNDALKHAMNHYYFHFILNFFNVGITADDS